MGFLDWFERDRKLTDYAPGELRREEERLRIRENQALSRLEQLEEDREAIFRRGALAITPVRRRILARMFSQRQRECETIEEDLSCLAKETLAVSAIRFRLECRLDGDSSVLKKVDLAALDALAPMFLDPTVAEEDFASEARAVLGKLRGQKGDPLKGIGRRAREVLSVWDRYDKGEFTAVDEGLMAMRAEAPDDAEEE